MYADAQMKDAAFDFKDNAKLTRSAAIVATVDIILL